MSKKHLKMKLNQYHAEDKRDIQDLRVAIESYRKLTDQQGEEIARMSKKSYSKSQRIQWLSFISLLCSIGVALLDDFRRLFVGFTPLSSKFQEGLGRDQYILISSFVVIAMILFIVGKE